MHSPFALYPSTVGLHIIFVLFFTRESPGMFSKEDFDLLAPVVDGFSLMTYDYPNHGRFVKYP